MSILQPSKTSSSSSRMSREFAGRAYRTETLDELEIQIESTNPNPADTATAVAAAIRDDLGLRAIVKTVPLGTLPRYELKSKRFTDERVS